MSDSFYWLFIKTRNIFCNFSIVRNHSSLLSFPSLELYTERNTHIGSSFFQSIWPKLVAQWKGTVRFSADMFRVSVRADSKRRESYEITPNSSRKWDAIWYCTVYRHTKICYHMEVGTPPLNAFLKSLNLTYFSGSAYFFSRKARVVILLFPKKRASD